MKLSDYQILTRETTLEHGKKDEMVEIMGDILWNLARLADNLGVDLNEVAAMNWEKTVKSKKENGGAA